MNDADRSRDSQFEQAAAAYGPALERLARAYEADPDTRRDLIQEILVALWRSLAGFDGRCSLRTWVYRVAHNTAASHVGRQLRRRQCVFVGLEEISELPSPAFPAPDHDQIASLYAMIHQLKPLDRQVILAYLEGLDAAAAAEITGLSPSNIAVKIHRIKHLLARRAQAQTSPALDPQQGGRHVR